MDIKQEIIKRIHENFPSLKVTVFPDKTQDNIIVAINDDIYYDDEYLALVMDIKMNLLWKNNIFNYLFVQEAQTILMPCLRASMTSVLSGAGFGTVLFPLINIYELAKDRNHSIIEHSVEND
jgi:hypothetical protein